VTTNDSWRRFLDTGAAVGQVTLTKAGEIAKGLMDPEPENRERAWRDLDDLGRAGRQLGEQLADLAKSRLVRQLGHPGSLEETIEWIADLVSTRTRHPGTAPAGDPDPLPHDSAPAPAKAGKVKQEKHKKKEKAAGGQGTKAGGSDKKHSDKKHSDKKHSDKKHKQGRGKKTSSKPGRVVTLTLASDLADRR
jgi:hypothetical protein